jgi:ABC-type amino acid transport substrate-binding protein
MLLRPATKGGRCFARCYQIQLDRLMSENWMSGVEVKFDFKPSFRTRVGDSGRVRRIAIVALARKLIVEDYRSFSFADVSGKVEGIDVDMAMSLAQSLGVRLEIVKTSCRPQLIRPFTTIARPMR